jgi:hypothetical protein
VNASTRLLAPRIFLALAVLGLALVQAICLWVRWEKDSGDALAGSQKAVLPLEVQLTVVKKRIREKENIIRSLAAGEMGLFEAAAWFRYLGTPPPEKPAPHWQLFPGRCEGEKLCRQVIDCTTNWLRGKISDSQLADWTAGKEAELEAHIARHGTVQLGEMTPPPNPLPEAERGRKKPSLRFGEGVGGGVLSRPVNCWRCDKTAAPGGRSRD